MQVEVITHNPRWKNEFEQEAQKIKEIYQELILDIHHIGSTSVPGLIAKPIIDIMPVVSDINAVDKFDQQMRALGYEPLGENGISDRRFFRKNNKEASKRTYHVHIFDQSNQNDIIRHLAFKAYLIAHPEIANQYGNLKSRLAATYPNDIESYIAGKNDFIKETEKQAVTWYKDKPNH
jgi:GrpB-like predicted nucleotidyltransferase (UPF0157 family)